MWALQTEIEQVLKQERERERAGEGVRCGTIAL